MENNKTLREWLTNYKFSNPNIEYDLFYFADGFQNQIQIYDLNFIRNNWYHFINCAKKHGINFTNKTFDNDIFFDYLDNPKMILVEDKFAVSYLTMSDGQTDKLRTHKQISYDVKKILYDIRVKNDKIESDKEYEIFNKKRELRYNKFIEILKTDGNFQNIINQELKIENSYPYFNFLSSYTFNDFSIYEKFRFFIDFFNFDNNEIKFYNGLNFKLKKEISKIK